MSCYCCEKDENDNYLEAPCCEHSGVCETESDLGMCIHCGASMFEENGEWFHHSQEEIPYHERGTRHIGPRSDNP